MRLTLAGFLLFVFIGFNAQAASHSDGSRHVSSYQSGGSPHEFGLGVVLGDPTAITGKYWFDSGHALQFGLGWWLGEWVEIYGDYLWHFPGAFSGAREPFFHQLSPYVGIGGDLHFHSSSAPPPNQPQPHWTEFLLRIPLGIEWLPPRAPIGVFLELVPAIEMVPGLTGGFEAGIGIRYYF
jgi:hypothetical protein